MQSEYFPECLPLYMGMLTTPVDDPTTVLVGSLKTRYMMCIVFSGEMLKVVQIEILKSSFIIRS